MKPKHNYDEEFKRNSVELYRSSNRGIGIMSRELGIAPETLRRWVMKDSGVKKLTENTELSRELSGRDALREIEKLRKELYVVSRQRDILKKALAIVNQQEENGWR